MTVHSLRAAATMLGMHANVSTAQAFEFLYLALVAHPDTWDF